MIWQTICESEQHLMIVFLENFQKFKLLFADDTLLMANDVTELQTMQNILSIYCKIGILQ